jgi:hypothetical protein
MSYIRALSNPEAMYAYGTALNGKGIVCISANTCVDRFGNHVELSMPASVFEGLFRKWKETIVDTTYKGAQLEEINTYQWRLAYKTWGKHAIVAYQVTWFYIATRITEER